MKVLAFGEITMRLEVPDHRLIHQHQSFHYLFTGTGFNFLAGLENYKIKTRMLSSVPDNNLGKAAIKAIAKEHIETQFIQSHGKFLASYILEKGTGRRSSQVTYFERSLSSFNTNLLDKKLIEAALQGIDYIHFCGIALGTSKISQENVMNIVEIAQTKNIQIIFDCNYRPSLVDGKDLKDVYQNIARNADILLGSKHDLLNVFEYEENDSVENLFLKFVKDYDLKVFAGTRKNGSEYQGFLVKDSQYFESEIFEIEDVLDPVGTGDAYASRIIVGIIRNEKDDVIVDKATKAGLLAHHTYGDVVVVNDEMIEHFIDSKGHRINR